MKKFLILMMCLLSLTFMTSCKEHFSDGERVGTVVKFSKAGVIWDSWDGDLNLTATGMNTSGEPFAFSFDNDRNDQDSLINLLIDAQRYGWKVKIIYHQVWGLKNICKNRGESDYFVDDVEILDKNFAKPLGGISSQSEPVTKGRVIDTVWVVIDKSQLPKKDNHECK